MQDTPHLHKYLIKESNATQLKFTVFVHTLYSFI